MTSSTPDVQPEPDRATLPAGGETSTNGIGQWVPIVIGIATIVATVFTGIPAFLTLTRDRPDLYYEKSDSSILNSSEDVSRLTQIREILKANHIPDSTLTLSLTNTGDTSAKETRIGVNVSGMISDVAIVPARKDKPVWVDLPDDLDSIPGSSAANVTFKNLAPSKVLKVNISYLSSGAPENSTNVDVFFDGKPAGLIPDINHPPTHSLFHDLKIPLIILGVGLAAALVISFLIILAQNKEVLVLLEPLLKEAFRLTVFFYPFR